MAIVRMKTALKLEENLGRNMKHAVKLKCNLVLSAERTVETSCLVERATGISNHMFLRGKKTVDGPKFVLEVGTMMEVATVIRYFELF